MMLYNLVQTIFRFLRATKSYVTIRIMQTTAVVARITKFQSKSDRKSFPSNSRSLFNIFKLCGFDFRGLFYIYLKFHFAVYPTFNIISLQQEHETRTTVRGEVSGWAGGAQAPPQYLRSY